ncbi:prepilin peptidase [Parasphingorhabdus cellanae]|uniref:prepilin peptidase n=1 Tax=Parasphingorhabdus cellanae TaxID=2806553 RepID=UPI001FB13B36|nr:A24 family peptidase [Parasphingorhabdus cellanae]
MPIFAFPIAGALIGLIIGSFLATIIIRWPQGRSAMKGRSRCDHCGRTVRAIDLIPVISYVLRAGKCAHCGTRIKADHLVIELGAGLIGGFALFADPGLGGILGAIFGWFLLTLAALDAQHHWLPDRLTFLLAISGLVASFVDNGPDLPSRLIGGFAGFALLFVIGWAYLQLRGREGLGGGDPKLLGAIGCWLGWSALPLVMLGAGLVGLLAIASMRARGQAITVESALPLGSFMAVSAFPLWIIQVTIETNLL